MARPRRVAAAALLALALAACDGDDPGSLPLRTPLSSPTRSDTVIIGLVGTMEDTGAPWGDDAFEGADLGVHVLNRSLDPDDRPYELVARNDEGDPEKATELVRDFAESERTVGIVYAGPPEALPAAEAALAEAGIPAIAVYGDLYGARELRPHVFQASPSFVWEARRIVSYALDDRRYLTMGALVSDTPTGRTALASLKAAVRERATRRPVRAQTYEPGETDLRPALEQLEDRGVEALVVEAGPRSLAAILRTLDQMDARYRTTANARIASARGSRSAARRAGRWRPQVMAFDAAISSRIEASIPAGTVSSDSYARGAFYLPVPSFVSFRSAFDDWWGFQPHGWQRRSYEAALMIGWAVRRGGDGADLAEVLEGLERTRFGGLDITFGPDDHTSVDQVSVGLWVVPRPGADVRERARLPESFPWVPLARGFSIDGEETDISSQDWRYLFRKAPPRKAPPPRYSRMRFGVTTPRSDPVH